MASSGSRDWMFSPVTGALMELDAQRGVTKCPISGYERKLSDIRGVKITYSSDMADFQRRFKLEPLVKREADESMAEQELATVKDACPKCGHEGMTYYTLQLRSADEGQTIFYQCMNMACKHKFALNS